VTPLQVLYVDDDADIRTIVGMSLALDPAIAVQVAASGEEGLKMLHAGPRPDIILLDVMMPGMDGPQMLDILRADPKSADIPVAFITAKGRQSDVESYLSRGATGVILKPFDPIRLAGEVRSLLKDHGPKPQDG
jgi:two-component system, OmpR family, response regulator